MNKTLIRAVLYVIIALAVIPLLIAHFIDSFIRTGVDVRGLHRFVQAKPL